MSSDAIPPPLPVPPKPKFTLPMSAWIAWGLFAMGRVALAFGGSGQMSAYQQGELFGGIVAMLLFSTFIAWVAWRVAGRSNIARTIGFFAVFALGLMGQVSTAMNRSSTKKALADFTTLQERHREAQRAAVNSGRPLDAKQAEKYGSDAAEQLRKVAENSTGDERAAAEAGKAFTERLLAANRRYNEAVAELQIDAFFQIAPLVDPEVIAGRRKRVQAFAGANAEMQKLHADGAALFQKELEQRRVSREFLRRTVAGYEESAGRKLPLILKIRETDSQFADAMLQFLDIAEGKHGKWVIKTGGKEVVFENTGTLARYNELLQLVDRLGGEQREYQKQLVRPVGPAKR
jgi:hypothetical protein